MSTKPLYYSVKVRSKQMFYRRPARQKSHYSLIRWARYILSRLFGTRLQRPKNLYFVTLNGWRFKRIILRDSYLASEIERNLERFGASEHFPPLVTCYENEVWVEYVDGTRLWQKKVDERFVEKMADFYAAVYARRPRLTDVAEFPFLLRLHQDLRFLNQAGVLSDDAYQELDVAAERLTPKQVWIGFDYIDPVLKNFVITRDSGQVCAVDVESLQDDQLIGTGVARARVRWLEPFLEVFFDRLAREGVPDFQPYFPFVELYFLARWTKMWFLEKKWKYVDPALFDRFRHLQ